MNALHYPADPQALRHLQVPAFDVRTTRAAGREDASGSVHGWTERRELRGERLRERRGADDREKQGEEYRPRAEAPEDVDPAAEEAHHRLKYASFELGTSNNSEHASPNQSDLPLEHRGPSISRVTGSSASSSSLSSAFMSRNHDSLRMPPPYPVQGRRDNGGAFPEREGSLHRRASDNHILRRRVERREERMEIERAEKEREDSNGGELQRNYSTGSLTGQSPLKALQFLKSVEKTKQRRRNTAGAAGRGEEGEDYARGSSSWRRERFSLPLSSLNGMPPPISPRKPVVGPSTVPRVSGGGEREERTSSFTEIVMEISDGPKAAYRSKRDVTRYERVESGAPTTSSSSLSGPAKGGAAQLLRERNRQAAGYRSPLKRKLFEGSPTAGRSSGSRAGSRASLSSLSLSSPTGHLVVEVIQARNLESNWFSSSRYPDPYAVVKLGDAAYRTSTLCGDCNPAFGSSFRLDLSSASSAASRPQALHVEVYNESNYVFDMFEASGEVEDFSSFWSPNGTDVVTVSSSSSGRVVGRSSFASPKPSGSGERGGGGEMALRRGSNGLITVDEALGSVSLPLTSLCFSSSPVNDSWYSLAGVSTGEIRIRTFYIEDPLHPPLDCQTAEEWQQEREGEKECEIMYDFYGFKIPREARQQWLHLQSYLQCRERRQIENWDRYLQNGPTFESIHNKSGSHSSSSTTSSRSSRSVLRRLVWQGIPRHLRETMYLKLSGADCKINEKPEHYYRSLVKRTATELDDTVKRQIELDINRTFGSAKTRTNTLDGREKLARILMAYALHNSTVGYCQGMNFIAGFLLVSMEEETTFWLLATICEDINPGYYTPTMIDTQADMRVLKELIRSRLPAIDHHAALTGLPLELVATQWLICLFTTTFPAETVFRVLDCIFLEGRDVMFAVILGHLRTHEKELLEKRDLQQFIGFLKQVEGLAYDADFLLSNAVKEMKTFNAGQIRAWRAKHRAAVSREVELMKRSRERGGQREVAPERSGEASLMMRSAMIVPAVQKVLAETVQMSALVLPDWLVFKYAIQAATWLVGSESRGTEGRGELEETRLRFREGGKSWLGW